MNHVSKRILVVDDDVYSMESFVRHLAAYGYGVDTAVDQRSACQALRNQDYDAIIIDCYFATENTGLDPRSAGIDPIRRIRDRHDDCRERNASCKIIVLTAMSDRFVLEELAGADVFRVLRKPIPTEEVLATLNEL